jgi:hypothetical protein
MNRIIIAAIGFVIGFFLVFSSLQHAPALPLPGHQPPFFLGSTAQTGFGNLSADGTANNKGTSSATVAINLSAATAGDIIVVATNCYRTAAQGSLTSVSTVASTNLPSGGWHMRKQLQMSGTNSSGLGITAFNDLEIWWTYSSATLSAESITITYGAACDCLQSWGLAVKGFIGTLYQTAPWDVNASLPAARTDQGTSELPNNPSITTTASHFMLIQAAGTYGGIYTQNLTSDATCCTGGAETNIDNSNTRQANLAVQYGPVPQTGTIASGYTLIMGGSMPFTYHAIADALTSP